MMELIFSLIPKITIRRDKLYLLILINSEKIFIKILSFDYKIFQSIKQKDISNHIIFHFSGETYKINANCKS